MKYQHFKMVIDEMYSYGDGYLLMSEIKFIDLDDNNFSFLTSDMNVQLTNLTPTGTSLDGYKLFDGNIDTKLCARKNTTSTSGTWVIQFYTGSDGIDISQYSRWQWYTAEDTYVFNGRNPKHFSLYLSEDGNDWKLVDTGSTTIITNKSLAYTGNITL